MRVSSHAIALIQNFEGLRTKAYKPLSHENGWTIGYGHHSPDVYEGMVCTEAEAEMLLKLDSFFCSPKWHPVLPRKESCRFHLLF